MDCGDNLPVLEYVWTALNSIFYIIRHTSFTIMLTVNKWQGKGWLKCCHQQKRESRCLWRARSLSPVFDLAWPEWGQAGLKEQQEGHYQPSDWDKILEALRLLLENKDNFTSSWRAGGLCLDSENQMSQFSHTHRILENAFLFYDLLIFGL